MSPLSSPHGTSSGSGKGTSLSYVGSSSTHSAVWRLEDRNGPIIQHPEEYLTAPENRNSSFARQRLCKGIRAEANAHNNRREVLSVVSAPRSLLSKGAANTTLQ